MSPELASRVDFLWEPLLPAGGLTAAAVALALFLVLSAWSTAGQPPGRRVGSLALRFLAAGVLLVVLAGPTRVTTRGTAIRDPLVLLLDASASMGVRDGESTRAEAVAAWIGRNAATLAEWGTRYDLRVLAFDGGTRPTDAAAYSAAPLAQGPDTDILSALEAVRPRPGEPRPAAAVLVTDGADRASIGRAFDRGGEGAVAPLVSGLPFPVHTFAAGSGGAVVDLRLQPGSVAPFAFVRRPLEVSVTLVDRGTGVGSVPVTLTRDGRAIGTQRVAIDPKTGTGATRFSFTPERVGWDTLRVSAPVPDGDQIPSNNAAEFTVKVIRDRTRILQVSSHPSWDVKFLRNLLKTDPNVDLVSFFIMRRGDRGGLDFDSAELSLIEFPHDDLFGPDLPGFDLVVFQNFAFEAFLGTGAGYYGNLAKYVQDGGSLLMLGGDRSFVEGGYAGTALEEVLPTSLPSAGPPGTTRFAAWPTADGLRHPVTRLGRDEADTWAAWGRLPRLQGWNALGDPRPGGVVLARVGGPDGPPLMAVRQAGKGRALALATDTSWRWALADGAVGSRSYARLFQNAVRWLVRDVEQKQVEVLPDQENYDVGARVRIEVRVVGADYAPLPDVEVQGRVAALGAPDGEPFAGRTDATGVLVHETSAGAAGTRSVTVTVPRLGREAGKGEARFSVRERAGELRDPEARPALLAALAAATSGRAFDLGDSLDEVPLSGPANLTATERVAEPLWNRWPLMVVAAASLAFDWILRRRRGML
ncbi:glutamine amidotransferase [Myxococcota bacterium]|nr:glutamine amidotransferase [Myxococcota bacterium]